MVAQISALETLPDLDLSKFISFALHFKALTCKVVSINYNSIFSKIRILNTENFFYAFSAKTLLICSELNLNQNIQMHTI